MRYYSLRSTEPSFGASRLLIATTVFGDGQKLVMSVGTNGIRLEKIQVHPTGLVDPNDPNARVKFLAVEASRGVSRLLLETRVNGSSMSFGIVTLLRARCS